MRSSLGAFNAQSTFLYTVVKMLSPLRARRIPARGSAKGNDTTPTTQSQGPDRMFGRSGPLAHPVLRPGSGKRLETKDGRQV